MRIAIIGSGISGLTAAHLLNKHHDITLYEKAARLGGHTATHRFELDGQPYAIDTGFIVYNDWTYPNFIELLNRLNVKTQATSMGFSVSCDKTGLEYAGNNLKTLFAQKKNLVSPKFLLMVRDILRFNQSAQRDLHDGRIPEDMTLGDYLKKNCYGDAFIDFYLLPMGAAIWSMSCERMLGFPLKFFVTFFKNHGLLNVKNRPTWRVIQGGSKEYIRPLVAGFKDRIKLKSEISKILRTQSGVELYFDDGSSKGYDHVVLAAHSDEALALLGDPSESENTILSSIPYEKNSVVLHYDERLLPKNKLTWSSWNYAINSKHELPTLTYNMNILQGLTCEKTFCVTLNDDAQIDEQKIIKQFSYAHPQFTTKGEQAKQNWSNISGVNRTHYCGAYWRNGFHEDGVYSAIRVAKQLGVQF